MKLAIVIEWFLKQSNGARLTVRRFFHMRRENHFIIAALISLFLKLYFLLFFLFTPPASHPFPIFLDNLFLSCCVPFCPTLWKAHAHVLKLDRELSTEKTLSRRRHGLLVSVSACPSVCQSICLHLCFSLPLLIEIIFYIFSSCPSFLLYIYPSPPCLSPS